MDTPPASHFSIPCDINISLASRLTKQRITASAAILSCVGNQGTLLTPSCFVSSTGASLSTCTRLQLEPFTCLDCSAAQKRESHWSSL